MYVKQLHLLVRLGRRVENQASRRGHKYSKTFSTKSRVGQKPQCQFIIGVEEDVAFGVVKRLLGVHGKHVKYLAEQSGARFRLRGRGSGFKEGPEGVESCDPLMLCVSAQDQQGYEVAKRVVVEHLRTSTSNIVLIVSELEGMARVM